MRSRNARLGVPLLAALAVAAAPGPDRPAADLVVVRSGKAHTVPVARERGYFAAPAARLARTLGYNARGWTVDIDGGTVRFFDGSPFFLYAGAIHQLPNEAYRSGAQVMVPVSWALQWLPSTQSHRWTNMDGRLVERARPAETPGRQRPWLVVIDPGHGGRDVGAVGVGGTREKDVTLAIASRLARKLQREESIELVLTRDRDTLVALADRPRIARIRGYDRDPDLFVSIHGNSMPRKPSSVQGFETYFLAVAKTEQARQVALRENSAVQYEEDRKPRSDELDPLQFVLSDLQSTGNLRESGLFAHSINRSLATTLDGPSLGVKQAGFWVLVGASMPAALVEVGYLSNRSEEKLLRSPSYQAKIADALADGIVNYLSGYGRRVWSSSPAGG